MYLWSNALQGMIISNLLPKLVNKTIYDISTSAEISLFGELMNHLKYLKQVLKQLLKYKLMNPYLESDANTIKEDLLE